MSFHYPKNEILRKIADLVTFTEKILNEKLHFLCSVCPIQFIMLKIFLDLINKYFPILKKIHKKIYKHQQKIITLK